MKKQKISENCWTKVEKPLIYSNKKNRALNGNFPKMTKNGVPLVISLIEMISTFFQKFPKFSKIENTVYEISEISEIF